jgi:hypothetical protein
MFTECSLNVHIINPKQEVPEQNLTLVGSYAVCTAITFGCMINAMVLSSLMLAAILKSGKNYVSEEVYSPIICNI